MFGHLSRYSFSSESVIWSVNQNTVTLVNVISTKTQKWQTENKCSSNPYVFGAARVL